MTKTPARWPGLSTAVLEVLPDPIFVKNEVLQFVWANAAFEDLFNVTRAEIAGRAAAQVFTGRSLTKCEEGDTRVMETGAPEEAYETFLRNRQEPRIILTRKTRLHLDGRYLLVGMMLDVTEASAASARVMQAPRLDA